MDFDMEQWVRRILLSSMSYQNDIDIIDKKIEGLVFGGADAQTAMEAVIGLMERKRRVVALRVITADMLAALSPRRRVVLAGRYIYEKTCADAAAGACLSVREYFRAHDAAISECAGYLTERGCGAQWFERYYGGEGWMSGGASRRHRSGGERLAEGGRIAL